METDLKFWWQEPGVVRQRPEKVVVKQHDDDGNFLSATHIPTIMYPLKSRNYELFNYLNTEPVEDEAVIEIFDRQKRRVGCCYTNTFLLTQDLTDAGYDAVSYAGWLFITQDKPPIHHCWTVLRHEQKQYVLDLSDCFSRLIWAAKKPYIRAGMTADDVRDNIVQYEIDEKDLPNHIHCEPVGCPTPIMLYVGTPCDPIEAMEQINELRKKYKEHHYWLQTDEQGRTRVHQRLAEHGLMNID